MGKGCPLILLFSSLRSAKERSDLSSLLLVNIGLLKISVYPFLIVSYLGKLVSHEHWYNMTIVKLQHIQQLSQHIISVTRQNYILNGCTSHLWEDILVTKILQDVDKNLKKRVHMRM